MGKRLDSYWELIEPIFSEVNTEDPESYFASIALLPRPIVLLYASHFCLSEVFNGGFLQFFWNSTGLMAPEAIEGFAVIGMPRLEIARTENGDFQEAATLYAQRFAND